MHQMQDGGKAIDRLVSLGRYPFGEKGWRDAYAAFLDLEPNYRRLKRRDGIEPRIGVILFWAVAAGLVALAILADGWLALVLSAVTIMYLLIFFVLAMGESLPWNE
jgi:fatty acid desaturase